MTRIVRFRRITLHFSHIGLTLGRTFIVELGFCSSADETDAVWAIPFRHGIKGVEGEPVAVGHGVAWFLLVAVGDAAPGQVIRG